MNRKFYSIITFCFLISCSNNNQDVNLQNQIQVDTSTNRTKVLFSNPRMIDSSHIVIYPLILEKTSDRGGFSSGSGGGDKVSFWNLVFYNVDNNTQHLLTDNKKIIIYSFNINAKAYSSSYDDGGEGINIYASYIFYDVVSNDFNQNKILDFDDPTYLYISDKQGNNFRQLSPDNYNIISWEVVKGTSKVILQAQKDNNGDKKFDQKDQVIPLIVDIETGKVAKETFSQPYIDSLNSILTNTWKVNK